MAFPFAKSAFGAPPEAVAEPSPRAWGALRGALATMLAWQERANRRAHMAAFDDHMLQDIGLTRADLEHEIGKPFWCG